MRLPLATNLKARTGTPDKDARVKNGIVEVKGESSLVRMRPGISESEATGLGLFAQGGMQFGRVLYSMNGDIGYYFRDGVFVGGYNFTLGTPLTMYANGGSYSIGDEVYADDPETGEVSKYYPYVDGLTGVAPSKTDPRWGTSPAPETRYTIIPFGHIGATVEAVAMMRWADFIVGKYFTCPGDPTYHLWYDTTYWLEGNQMYTNIYGTAGVRPCGDPGNGPYQHGPFTIVPV